jgi:hypothetical protein
MAQTLHAQIAIWAGIVDIVIAGADIAIGYFGQLYPAPF